MFTQTAQAVMADPQYAGPLEAYTHYGAAGVLGEGPFMQMWLVVEQPTNGGSAIIRRTAYRSNGCPSSMAAGSMAARVLTGMPVDKALLLTGDDLLKILGGLPEGKEEAAFRAVAAAHDALHQERIS